MLNLSKIKENANNVRRVVDRTGEMPVKKLAATLGLGLSAVLMAIGWLSRENKIEVSELNGEMTARLPRCSFYF